MRTVLVGAAMVAAGAMIADTSAAQTTSYSAPVMQRVDPWSGTYGGFQLGGHFVDSQVVTAGQSPVNASNVASGARPTRVDVSRNGAFGGIQFGYGRQLLGLYVGGEADSAFGRFIGGHILTTSAPGVGGTLINTYESHQRFIGTIRGKVGRPFGRVLVYGTGGLAIGGFEQRVTFNGPAPASVVQFTANRVGIWPGYAVGGGAEYRVSRRLSYQVESLYYYLQNETLNVAVVPGSGGSGAGYKSTLQNSGDVLRVGINYHF